MGILSKLKEQTSFGENELTPDKLRELYEITTKGHPIEYCTWLENSIISLNNRELMKEMIPKHQHKCNSGGCDCGC